MIKLVKTKMGKIRSVHQMNLILIGFSLEMAIGDGRDNLFELDRDDLYTALNEIKNNNNFICSFSY